MILYRTVSKSAEAEYNVEKSRFIAHIKPVTTREEADAFISAVRKKYYDATHNVPALVLGDKFQIQWASDDGEPQGTSGAPIVQMLVNERITNVVIVVTRYFGGIKLGTGGLVRAYTTAAKAALELAGIREVKEIFVLTVEVGYPYINKLKKLAENGDFDLIGADYADNVVLTLSVDLEKKEELFTILSEVTGGKEKILKEVQKNA